MTKEELRKIRRAKDVTQEKLELKTLSFGNIK